MGQTQLEPKLIKQLKVETNPVMRLTNLFALGEFPPSDDPKVDRELVAWLVKQQRAELNDASTKGVHYPGFLKSIVYRLAERSPDAFASALDETVPGSFLADGVYLAVAHSGPAGVARLMRRLADTQQSSHQVQLVEAPRDSELNADQVSQLIHMLSGTDDRNLARYVRETIVRQQMKLTDLGDTSRQEQLTGDLLNFALAQRHQTGEVNVLLAHLTGQGLEELERSNLSGEQQLAVTEHWLLWYRQQFGRPLATNLPKPGKPLAAEEIYQFILESKNHGNSERGRLVYLQSRCYACHGGGSEKNKANTFGPALTGVTQRLKLEEFADALVYPSKKVDDRFRSTVVTTTDGKVLTGFLTQGDDSITLVEPDGQLHIVPANKVDDVGVSKVSPMPEGLLQYLDKGEIDDLLAYLRSL